MQIHEESSVGLQEDEVDECMQELVKIVLQLRLVSLHNARRDATNGSLGKESSCQEVFLLGHEPAGISSAWIGFDHLPNEGSLGIPSNAYTST
jgi:hypothetical protein